MAAECPSVPRWSFTQGVLVGQASFVIIAVLFLKYVVFEDPAKHPQARPGFTRSKKRSAFPLSALAPGSVIPSLLSAIAYDLPTHPPETLDWLNVLLAQTISAYRTLVVSSTTGTGGAVGLMEEMLNRRGNLEGEESDQGIVGIDRIVVSDVAMGEKYPILSNARVRPSGEGGGVRVELDLDYNDHVSLAISTCLLVNFPRPRFAVLPISLGLTLQRFSGTVTVELPSPLSSSPSSIGSTHPTLHFSLHPDFTLDLTTTSLLGSRAKLQDVPKVEQLILARLRGWIQDRVVWPGRVQIALPSISTHTSASYSAVAKPQGQVDGGWEWVEDDESEDIPTADSSDEMRPGPDSGSMTPTVDYDDGPTVLLHPRIRPRQPPYGSPPPEFPRPPSPTESLPGHYHSTSRDADLDHDAPVLKKGAWALRGHPQQSAMRLRANGVPANAVYERM